MDDTTKWSASAAARIEQEPESTSQNSGEAFIAFMDDSADQGTSTNAGQKTLPPRPKHWTGGSKSARKTMVRRDFLRFPTKHWSPMQARCNSPVTLPW